MNKSELILARQRQLNLRKKLEEAEKLVSELQTRKSKLEAEAITRAILSIEDENILMEVFKLIEPYVISNKDRRALGLNKKENIK
jgi:hypothetical protein